VIAAISKMAAMIFGEQLQYEYRSWFGSFVFSFGVNLFEFLSVN